MKMAGSEDRIGVICDILTKKPLKHVTGKTSIMKLIYILQQVYEVPLGYEYALYTYGPYSPEVMNDIDYARQIDAISVNSVTYSPGLEGYQLETTGNSKREIKKAQDFINLYKEQIEKTTNQFGNRNAKELELIATIIYLCDAYETNGLNVDVEAISKKVHEIKPHFSPEEIKAEYSDLCKIGIIEKVG
jgi:uncharacterized protein YwgA